MNLFSTFTSGIKILRSAGYGLFACNDKRVTEIPVKPGLNGLKASYASATFSYLDKKEKLCSLSNRKSVWRRWKLWNWTGPYAAISNFFKANPREPLFSSSFMSWLIGVF